MKPHFMDQFELNRAAERSGLVVELNRIEPTTPHDVSKTHTYSGALLDAWTKCETVEKNAFVIMLPAHPILNREFQFDPNNEIEVLRFGDFPHSSGIVQVIDAPALNTMVAQFDAEKQRLNFPGFAGRLRSFLR